MNKIIGINYLNSPINQREILRPVIYSKMPTFQSNGQYTYARIYKNAHQSLKSFFHSLGYNEHYFDPREIKSNQKVIVVLRDPLDRWISGLNQYLIQRVPNLAKLFGTEDSCKVNEDIIKLCIDHVVMDLHTECQVKFLYGLRYDQCVFFYLNENLEENLIKFLEETTSKKINIPLPKINLTANNNKKILIKQIIINFLESNENEKNNLLKALELDTKLINDIQNNKGFINL